MSKPQEKQSIKEIKDTIAKLDEMQITARWINDEFLSVRLQKTKKTEKTNIFFRWLSACCEEPKSDEQPKSPSEQAKQQRIEELSKKLYERLTDHKNKELSKKLYERLTDHAIYSHKQLEDVAMQAGGVALLHEILECKGAAEAISKYYDNLNALKESFEWKWKSIEVALTGDLESMDAFLMNFGLAAALIGGAAMSNFTSITKDDWLAYLPLALLEKACQAKAKKLCGDEALSPDQLGWEPLYCQEAVELLIENPTMDLTNTSTYPDPDHPDLSCCMGALECAKNSKWNLELAYTVGCGGASAAMLLVVLFSAWIFISLHASSANRGRSEEANLLRDQFKDEFVIVHVLFFFGVIFGFVGSIAVISLKVGTLALSWTAWGITVFAAILAIILFVKCPWEVYKLNQTIDKKRDFNKDTLVAKYKDLLDNKYVKCLEAQDEYVEALQKAQEAEAEAPKADAILDEELLEMLRTRLTA